jgi:hypothetical protein
MKTDLGCGFDVRLSRIFVQENRQFGSLSEVSGGGAAADQVSRFDEKIVWKTGAIQWEWARQENHPWLIVLRLSISHSPKIAFSDSMPQPYS